MNHLTANFPQYDYVVVNDGSRDETAAICQRNGYNLLNLPVNLGLAGHSGGTLNMPTSTDINMRSSSMETDSTVRSIWNP